MSQEQRAVGMLERAGTIAVVGMSSTPGKAAHHVPAGLVAAGWRVLPVNPSVDSVLGLRAYDRLDEIGERVDLVDVFRPAADAPDVARQAATIGAGGLWLQLGIVSEEARRIADNAGIEYVEDLCIDVVRRLYGIRPAESDQPGT